MKLQINNTKEYTKYCLDFVSIKVLTNIVACNKPGTLDREACVCQCLALREGGNHLVCHLCRNHILECCCWRLAQIRNILETIISKLYVTINQPH